MFKVNKIIRRMRKIYLDKNLKKKKRRIKETRYIININVYVYLIIKSEYKN